MLLACAVIAVAGASAATAREAPFVPWTQPLPGAPLPFSPNREADCASGAPGCIDRTLARMYRRFDRLYASCDHNGLFALVYIRVTEAIRAALRRNFYEEPRFLQHEDAVFARMYFTTFDAWARGDRSRVPPAWAEALDAGRARSVNGVGNLLMSMNAHINRDMPFMLANLGLTMPDGRSRKPDHDRGNAVLQPLYDDTFREIYDRWDTSARQYDDPNSTTDDLVLFQVLPAWREQVWRNAEALISAPTPDARRAVAEQIEQYALDVGRLIKSQTTISSSAARDAHCRQYRATHRERGALARPIIRRAGLRARRRGTVRVRLRCPAGIRWCDGTLALGRSSRRFAAIAPGRSALAGVLLDRRARRALRRRGRLRLRLAVRSTTPWGLAQAAARTAWVRWYRGPR